MTSSNPPPSEITAYILGALTALGGTMGYVRQGSVPSIAAGLLVGSLYTVGGMRMNAGQPYGIESALLASVVLAGAMLPRAAKTGKQIPVGMSLLALYGLFYFGKKYMNGPAR